MPSQMKGTWKRWSSPGFCWFGNAGAGFATTVHQYFACMLHIYTFAHLVLVVVLTIDVKECDLCDKMIVEELDCDCVNM